MPDQSPWEPQKPPQDINDLIDEKLKKFFEFFTSPSKGKSPKKNGNNPKAKKPKFGSLMMGIGIAVLLYLAFQSFHQIQPGERGIVLLFGKYNRTVMPGLNFVVPVAEDLIRIDIERVREEKFSNVQVQGRNETETTSNVSLMLTGDKNVININWVVQYQILSPQDFLFNVSEPSSLVRDISESVMRRLVGNRDFDYVLNFREELSQAAQVEMQALLNKYNLGVQLNTVQLQDVTPPSTVRPAFNDVNAADQDKTRLVNEAQQIFNDRIPKARGEALRLLEEAEGYAVRRVNQAEGDVARFQSIYQQYLNYRTVTRTRMYIETMKEVLPNIEEVYIVDQNNNVLPLLNLTKTN